MRIDNPSVHTVMIVDVLANKQTQSQGDEKKRARTVSFL